MELFIDILKDTTIDTVKLIPFLFLTYLAMEYLENKAGQKTVRMLLGAGKKGPVIGGILGVVPQCGFSAAAANLYSGGVITVGTMIAVFLSTSKTYAIFYLCSSCNDYAYNFNYIFSVLFSWKYKVEKENLLHIANSSYWHSSNLSAIFNKNYFVNKILKEY